MTTLLSLALQVAHKRDGSLGRICGDLLTEIYSRTRTQRLRFPFRMKSFGFLLLGFLLGGCQPSMTVPQDRFNLSVAEVITGEDIVVSVLKITAPKKVSISVDAEGSHNHVTPGDPLVEGPRKGEILLTAARVAPGGSEDAFIQVLMRARDQAGYAGGPAVFRVPTATKLQAFFKLTAADGTFALDEPLKIAELRGKPVKLTVGKPTK